MVVVVMKVLGLVMVVEVARVVAMLALAMILLVR